MAIPAILVRLNISQFSNSRQDPAITGDVKAAHKLTGNAGKWIKNKLPEIAFKAIKESANAARILHYELTLPWEESYGLLPVAARERYETEMSKCRKDFEEAVEAFLGEYKNWKDQAKLMHGKTYNESDYPSASEVRASYRFVTMMMPFPESSHFNQQLRGLYGSELERVTNARIEAAVAETWNRLVAPLQHMAERLSSPDTIFRDSLVQNVKDIVELIPSLNLTGNDVLQQAAREINERFKSLDAETLRNDKVQRREVAQAAAAFVKRFGSMGSTRKFAA